MLTVKALSPDKTVMGEADGVYGPAGNSSLVTEGTLLKIDTYLFQVTNL